MQLVSKHAPGHCMLTSVRQPVAAAASAFEATINHLRGLLKDRDQQLGALEAELAMLQAASGATSVGLGGAVQASPTLCTGHSERGCVAHWKGTVTGTPVGLGTIPACRQVVLLQRLRTCQVSCSLVVSCSCMAPSDGNCFSQVVSAVMLLKGLHAYAAMSIPYPCHAGHTTQSR